MCFLSKIFKKSPKKDNFAKKSLEKDSNILKKGEKVLNGTKIDPKSTPNQVKNTPKKVPEKPKITPITVKTYLMGRDSEFPLDATKERNVAILLKRVNGLLEEFGKQRELRSGYRPGHYNVAAGGSKNSTHMNCEGIDIADTDDLLKNWILDNKNVLEKYDLSMEDPRYTDTWVHLQSKRVKSGRRIYIPY